MHTPSSIARIVTLALLLAACGDTSGAASSSVPRELTPVLEPFGPDDPLYADQPHRERPSAIAQSPDGRELYVTLQGTDNAPERTLAIVDARTLQTKKRVRVGPGPCAVAVHPSGEALVVLNRFARYASVVDLTRREVSGEIAVPFYSEGLAFSHDGSRLYVSNRFHDVLLRFEVEPHRGALRHRPLDEPDDAGVAGIALPNNPRRVIVSADDRRVLVTSEAALTLTLLDAQRGTRIAEYSPNAPVLDAAIVAGFVYVLHTGSGTQHPPNQGFDGDGDGHEGDGTANVGFQDVQNEIDVLRLRDLSRVERYTSDSICCRDFRDVDPDHPDAGRTLPEPDAWPPNRVSFLPGRETWIVAGALPERALAIRRSNGSPALAVIFSGSSQAQTFDVDPDYGLLHARESAAEGLYRTGFGAVDAVALDDGARLVVVNRLGESLSAVDLREPPTTTLEEVTIGDVSGGEFPATDAELGEALNFMTAMFTVDGDQTCAHCHRDGTAIGKAVSMPLLAHPEWGARQILSYRNAYDSRPWFAEAAMDEETFVATLNELARRENFCCEQLDSRIWSLYPTREQCLADETLPKCNHVLHCETEPPPECDERSFGAPELTRDLHFQKAALRLFGRDQSFGDALRTDGSAAPIALDFAGVARALALFLLSHSRELPNPHAVTPLPGVERGRALFESAATGCSTCHPLPFAATALGTAVSDDTSPLRLPYVVTPLRHPRLGYDVDLVSDAFLTAFPMAQQTGAGLRFGVPSLRGAWDRTRFLHHGRARSLGETLATPGHPSLSEGQRGYNERDGQPDTHGSTSPLAPDELGDLITFVRTL